MRSYYRVGKPSRPENPELIDIGGIQIRERRRRERKRRKKEQRLRRKLLRQEARDEKREQPHE
jgi:hypothetical protein